MGILNIDNYKCKLFMEPLTPNSSFIEIFESTCSYLRRYVTSRKVVGSFPNVVIWTFFNVPNLSSRTMALGLTNRILPEE
jgi:hypothetical protein